MAGGAEAPSLKSTGLHRASPRATLHAYRTLNDVVSGCGFQKGPDSRLPGLATWNMWPIFSAPGPSQQEAPLESSQHMSQMGPEGPERGAVEPERPVEPETPEGGVNQGGHRRDLRPVASPPCMAPPAMNGFRLFALCCWRPHLTTHPHLAAQCSATRQIS